MNGFSWPFTSLCTISKRLARKPEIFWMRETTGRECRERGVANCARFPSYRQRQRQHCADCDYRACQRGLNPAPRELSSRRSNARARVVVSIRRYLSTHIVIYYTGIYVYLTDSYYVVVLCWCKTKSVFCTKYLFPEFKSQSDSISESYARMRSRTRSRERQRQRERPAQRELCRSSAILQLICAAIARTVIGFLKITINSLRRLATVCVRSCVWLCVCLSDTPPSYMYI